jgi:hypothetical protein
MHHEIVRELFYVVVLEQKSCFSMLRTGELRVGPLHRESKIGVEALRELEVLRRHECPECDGGQE